MLTNTIISDDHSRKNGRLDFVSILHRIACAYSILLMVYCLLHCYLAFTGALQDVHKFEHTGTFPFFLYFLDEHRFLEDVCTFVIVTAEFLLYIALYRCAERNNPFRAGVLYIVGILVIHVVMYLHANSLPIPDYSYHHDARGAALSYRVFANDTVLPPVIYFVMYLLRIWKSRLTEKRET